MNKISNLFGLGQQARSVVRNYAFKSDLKIKWVRPEKISCIKPEKSGDLAQAEVVPPKAFLFDFQESKELQSAPEIIKQIFSVDSNRKSETRLIRRQHLVAELQRHKQDYGSIEAKLADQTAKIRHLQEYMEKHQRNSRSKVVLKELIDKRKRFLRYLRRWDYKRFEWALEKLDIIYKPYPSEYHWITRKDSLRKLTDTHCADIREERLLAYRKELESQQISFLERKLSNLEMIHNEQKELKLPVTVSPDDIKAVRKQLQGAIEKKKPEQEEK